MQWNRENSIKQMQDDISNIEQVECKKEWEKIAIANTEFVSRFEQTCSMFPSSS